MSKKKAKKEKVVKEAVKYEIKGKRLHITFKNKEHSIAGKILSALKKAKDYAELCKIEREHKLLDKVDAGSNAKRRGKIKNTQYDSRKKLARMLNIIE